MLPSLRSSFYGVHSNLPGFALHRAFYLVAGRDEPLHQQQEIIETVTWNGGAGAGGGKSFWKQTNKAAPQRQVKISIGCISRRNIFFLGIGRVAKVRAVKHVYRKGGRVSFSLSLSLSQADESKGARGIDSQDERS